MNVCRSKVTSLYDLMKGEAYLVKYYAKGRYQDITSLIKREPIFVAVMALGLVALVVHATALYLFSVLFMVLLLDYLDHTYFYEKAVPPSSNSISSLMVSLTIDSVVEDYREWREKNLEQIKKMPDADELMKEMYTFDEVIEERAKGRGEIKNDTRPALLFLRARADHNGALGIGDAAVTINGDNEFAVEELRKRYKIVLIDEITDIDHIEKKLARVTNRIQFLWILAHGSSTAMQLDDNNFITSSNIDQLAELLQPKLAADAHIFLQSCNTGQSVQAGKNIATLFSKNLPGRTIWAAQTKIHKMALGIGEDPSETQVRFFQLVSRLKFLIKKVSNICTLQPFEKIKLKRDVTARFKEEVEV